MLARSTLWSQACGKVCVASYEHAGFDAVRKRMRSQELGHAFRASFSSSSRRFTASVAAPL